ncbi:hypothetical protein C8A05DRAFT_15456 [Staphylotrichum tortipilum]|uniref:S-adenosylmethionine-dependent methyltransferase-like protein n=1 Tax=Staphylotrichum tortipilum TaxID=2831512 RepID=A0AAN6RUF4_9PEZI|nr:hypothetical protein C8A05DRAFT_15456 [Staphylotrichum longicolle]
MPSRIPWAGKNNRSQHNLAGSSTAGSEDVGGGTSGGGGGGSGSVPGAGAGGGGAANPPSASPNTAFSSSESFQPDPSSARGNHNHAQQQGAPHPPPPHLVNIYGTAAAAAAAANTNPTNPSASLPPQLQHSNSVSGVFDSRQRDQLQQDFADQVARSQSHRYAPQSSSGANFPTPTQLQQQQQQQEQQQQQQQQQQLDWQNQQHLQSLQSHHQHSHSHTHPQQAQSPPLGSGSVEDLISPGHGHGHQSSITSPILGAPHHHHSSFSHHHQQQLQQQQQQHPPPQPPKPKQSTRRLIKNILNPRGQDHQAQVHNSQFGSASAPARRNSKRVSLQPPYPPALRTGLSQVSLDQQQQQQQQQQLDWQNQNQGPPVQTSPLQGVGDFRESYIIEDSDQDPRFQAPQDLQHPTIRPVPPSDPETSPYSVEDPGYRQHRGHVPSQSQVELQHQQQYAQAVFDASPHQQQYPQFPSQQHQQQQQYPGAGQQQLYLASPQPQNPETVSQLSHESPVTDSDQRSATNIPAQTAPALQTSPTVNYPSSPQDHPGRLNPSPPQATQHRTPPPQQQQQQQQTMVPPPGGQPPARRSQDADKMRDQVQPPPGPPPSYRQSQQPNMNPLPQPPNPAQQNPNFRASNVPPERQGFEGQGDLPGRNSPQPPPSDRGGEDPEKAFKDLLTKYKNVKRLYFDGKKEIEHLNAQVEQLQNAIANQRMSQSRTSLDDSEYTTRFNRLNGAINNLSFNIRKDWVTLPAWIIPFVSPDALKTGKQEMTAVGRAVITRWIVDEIFNRCFHPGLNPELSQQLKMIELNIRHFSYTMNSQEEYDALTSKVVSWRMATLEGLQDVLRSNDSIDHRNDFTRRATSNLTASLFQHLAEPPPAGVDGSASMIVELAVGIATNLPLESRDVAIIYTFPETPIQPELMEVEKTGLPPLEARPSDLSEEGAAEDGSGGSGGGGGGGAGAGGGKDAGKDGSAVKDRRGGGGADSNKRTGMLSVPGGGGSGGTGGSAPSSRKGSIADGAIAPPHTAPPPPKDPGKVRFAGFVAVEVRGRQVLVKAPVWTLG